MSTNHDLLIIGAGPGGYVAAIRAAQLGLNVGIIDKGSTLGGTCLNIGCIPSKALLESSYRFHDVGSKDFAKHGVIVEGVKLDLAAMLKRKDAIVRQLTTGIAGLMKKNGITVYTGKGKIIAAGRVQVEGDTLTEVTASKIIIATGSKVTPLRGCEIDGERIGTSTEALCYEEVPKHLVVIGAGVIGLELGSVWRRLGAEVTVVEYMDRVFPPMDGEICKAAKKIFEKQGIKFVLGAAVTCARADGDGAIVEIDGQEPIKCDRVLVAVGRIPNTDGLGLENIGIEVDKRGRIPVKDHWQTNVADVYAIGDVIEGPMLAHKAEDEGMAVAEFIVTGYAHINYDAIPSIVYTHPEVAMVGKTEEQLNEAGIPFKKGSFPFMANGRAKALGDTDGFVKILAHAETDRVLGAHIIGPAAGDLIAEVAVGMEWGASAEDIARACHAHPTLSEVVKEAALAVAGRAIHM